MTKSTGYASQAQFSVPEVLVNTLAVHYADRLAAAREARKRGTGVVGRIGNTVPTELVLACGWIPVLVAADMGTPTPTADVYMEPVIAPETRSLFELALNGSYQDFELLVLSRPYAHLYYYLKEVLRQGKARRLPPLWMYDLMQSQRDAVRAYNWDRTRALVERLESLAGVELTDTRLRAAIDSTNGVRRLQHELLDRRWRGEVSGVDALRAIGAGYFMAPDDYAQTLAEYLAELSPIGALEARPHLLVLPSEPLSHTHLHQALEDAGGLVVAEDDGWGSRAPGNDVPRTGSALEGIFLKYWSDSPTQHVYPAEAREAWFTEHAARQDVDGVVFYLPPSDHQLGWDYPRLHAWLNHQGKPSLLIREDASTDRGRVSISERAKDWLETLR
jgi:benzoyl-CoA reductase/2-hydroxyglutaryl-CoA dehydratase subunit BcrC/BadD/HgdB